MSGALSPIHWLIIIGVLVVLFGAKKLPDAARGIGQSLRIFKAETSAGRGGEPAAENSGPDTGQPTPTTDQTPGASGHAPHASDHAPRAAAQPSTAGQPPTAEPTATPADPGPGHVAHHVRPETPTAGAE